jgi:hypothetical protein
VRNTLSRRSSVGVPTLPEPAAIPARNRVNSSQRSGREDIVPKRYGDVIDGLYRVAAMQPAYEPYRHTGTLPRSNGIAVAERVFPVL